MRFKIGLACQQKQLKTALIKTANSNNPWAYIREVFSEGCFAGHILRGRFGGIFSGGLSWGAYYWNFIRLLKPFFPVEYRLCFRIFLPMAMAIILN